MMVERKRRLEPDVLDLRSQPRRGPRAEPAVVQGLPPSVARGVLPAVARQPRLVFPRLDEHAGSALEEAVPHLDGRACANSAARAASITTGDDAGYIYSMYGFGIARELELHEEAGFHPLEVIEHATWNGARMLGLEDRLGKVREGFIADLLVVNGNPLENLKLLNPYGTDVMLVNGRPVVELHAGRPGRSRAGRARRRHRVDDQGRHPVSRADADARGAGHGRAARARRDHARRKAADLTRRAGKPASRRASTSRSTSTSPPSSRAARRSSIPTRSAPGGRSRTPSPRRACSGRTRSNGGRPSIATRSWAGWAACSAAP